MSKDVASSVIRGAVEINKQASDFLAKAMKEKGEGQKIGFPDTAFYFPMANALLGARVETLEDMLPIQEHARSLLPQAPTDKVWLPYLGDALNAGMATLFNEELIVGLRYLYGQEPQKDCIGFFSDTILRSLGIQLVDGRMPGFAAILGAAPTNKIAVDIIRELQERSILMFVGSNVKGRSIIDQLIEEGIQMGWENYIVPYGRDTITGIYALNWAIRGALTFGGIKSGDAAKCLAYTKERVFAFGLVLGELDDIKYATGAGAINMGFPIIADTDIPEIKPSGITTYEALVKELGHKKIVPRCIEVRGIKIKIAKVPVPVPFSPAFEGERVRRQNMYVQFGGKFSTAFEYLRMRKLDEITDGKVEVVGQEIDSMADGSAEPLGILVEVAGRRMVADFEPILERQIHKFLNYAMGIFHMGQRDMNWIRISKDARGAGFKIKHFGDILAAKLKDEYGAIVDKVQVTLYTDENDVKKLIPEANSSYQARDARMAGMSDESVDTFYSCTLCQSFAPDHVCVVSPERLGLCGAYSWLDAKAAHEITPTGGNQPIKKGRVIDQAKGLWEGINNFVYDKSHHKTQAMAAYSLMDSPMTSCGCFECIVAIVPEANGVMVVNREYSGETPAGMRFTTLASSVGGGGQTPGFVGVGRLYVVSKKFISAEGGLARIVWMPKELKEALADKLKIRAKEVGEPDLFDKIADETVATDAAALVAHLEKVKHPALTMNPLV
jgi:acetyl-CoA synthase